MLPIEPIPENAVRVSPTDDCCLALPCDQPKGIDTSAPAEFPRQNTTSATNPLLLSHDVSRIATATDTTNWENQNRQRRAVGASLPRPRRANSESFVFPIGRLLCLEHSGGFRKRLGLTLHFFPLYGLLRKVAETGRHSRCRARRTRFLRRSRTANPAFLRSPTTGKEPAADYANYADEKEQQPCLWNLTATSAVIRVIRGWFPRISGLVSRMVRNTGQAIVL